MAGLAIWLLAVSQPLKLVLSLVLIGPLSLELWRTCFRLPLAAIACDDSGLRIKRPSAERWEGCRIIPVFASPWFIASRLCLPATGQTMVLGLFYDQVDPVVFRRLASLSRNVGHSVH